MDETIVIPSPNWFQSSILAASKDGWLVYGGPFKSLCFLEPLPSDTIGIIDSKQRFRVHTSHRAHKEKIVSVDISPEWSEKRNLITGSLDGVVKEWSIELKEGGWNISYIHCHEEHSAIKEELVGVCYSMHTYAVSVGSQGNLCKWDLTTNVVKRYSTHLNYFRPTCISVSPHKHLHVAVGTRQGVIFVVDISGMASKLIYKVRGQDDEINKVSWCPQYTVTINKSISKEKHKPNESFSASSRMDRIRNDQEPSEALEKALEEKDQKEKEKKEEEEEEEVIIPEDDMFDVYKDHEVNEFGHKKYEPEEILVKVKEEPKDDFLAECEKLKAEILKKKNEPEESIESLVEALDKAHVEEKGAGDCKDVTEKSKVNETSYTNEYAHLLASIGKYGGVRIWTKTGKLLSSCIVTYNKKDPKEKNKGVNWPTLHWFKPDSLLLGDGKNQVLETNPLSFDSKNKLTWQVVHSLHRRGLFFLSSNAPRVQTPDILSSPEADKWVVWTVGQDRNVISYDMKERKKIEVWTSSGAFIFEIRPCAYDAGKIAMAAGDGSIRVWETYTTNELGDQLSSGVITSYWQSVQGKILTIAWHPTKENLLAFGTAEARVGIIDACGIYEKPAKTFPNFFKNSVYAVCWGEGMDLYACGNGELAVFHANKVHADGQEIPVVIDGQQWAISSVVCVPHGLLVGSCNGGVALLDRDYQVICTSFVFLKTIYTIAWHPQQTTNSQEESKYQNYIAVTSAEKLSTIAILEYDDKEGVKQFKRLDPLSGHEGAVLHAAWNPHRDAQLLSTSTDATVRVWNVLEGLCIAIYGGHTVTAQGAMWWLQPRLADKVLSCGGDACVRLWDIKDFPTDNFAGVKKDPRKKKSRSKTERKGENKYKKPNADKVVDQGVPQEPEVNVGNVAIAVERTLKGSKVFLLPNITRQVSKETLSQSAARKFFIEYLEKNTTIDIQEIIKSGPPKETGLYFLKMFGTINDLNELLDFEAQRHLEERNWEAYSMLMFFRGKVDEMIQFACENDRLDDYLVSLSPSVSIKYWKDTNHLYIAQVDRLVAKGLEEKKAPLRFYGGLLFRKAMAYLCTHNLKACIDVLLDSLLYKEAYILCRLRHVDSIAEEVLSKWARGSTSGGCLMLGAILHLVRGDTSEAAMTLGHSNHIKPLKLAALLAKCAGHNAYAALIESKLAAREDEITSDSDEELEALPSRTEAFLDKLDHLSDNESEHELNVNAGLPDNAVNGNAVKKSRRLNLSARNCNDTATNNVEKIEDAKPSTSAKELVADKL